MPGQTKQCSQQMSADVCWCSCQKVSSGLWSAGGSTKSDQPLRCTYHIRVGFEFALKRKRDNRRRRHRYRNRRRRRRQRRKRFKHSNGSKKWHIEQLLPYYYNTTYCFQYTQKLTTGLCRVPKGSTAWVLSFFPFVHEETTTIFSSLYFINPLLIS